jgi:hypothetical protein
MALHQRATEFRARNLLLHLALGMHRQGLTLRALLDRYAPADAPRVPAARGDDALIAATLGLVALFARLDHHLQTAAANAPSPPDPPARSGVPRGVLR